MGASSIAIWYLRRQMAWTAHPWRTSAGVLPSGAIVAVLGPTSDNKEGGETTKLPGKAVDYF